LFAQDAPMLRTPVAPMLREMERKRIARMAAKRAWAAPCKRVFDSIFASAATQGCDSKANLAD